VTDVGEDWLGVALRAGYVLVQTAQGEARGVVIKFWNRPDRFPAIQGVAVLARSTQWSVGAARGLSGLRLGLGGRVSLSGGRQSRQRRSQKQRINPDSRAQGSLPYKVGFSPLDEEQIKHRGLAKHKTKEPSIY